MTNAVVMSAAALAEGTTLIESAACEPEIVDLARMLNAMRATELREFAKAEREEAVRERMQEALV